jgi:hypothetical protein
MPVILATWVAEIGRIVIQEQPRQKSCETPFQWKKAGHGSNACHPSDGGKLKIGKLWDKPAWAKSIQTVMKKKNKNL